MALPPIMSPLTEGEEEEKEDELGGIVVPPRNVDMGGNPDDNMLSWAIDMVG